MIKAMVGVMVNESMYNPPGTRLLRNLQRLWWTRARFLRSTLFLAIILLPISATSLIGEQCWCCMPLFIHTILLLRLFIRARWILSTGIKLLKIKSGHLHSYVKLNFKASLFSCLFWFEAIFLGKWALLFFCPCGRKNGSKMIKIWLKTHPKVVNA